MKERPPIVLTNPFAELDLPRIEPRTVEFYEPAEAAALYEAIERLSGPKWRTLAELGMQVGQRPGEMYGLHGHRVDWLRGRIEVVDVMTAVGCGSGRSPSGRTGSCPCPLTCWRTCRSSWRSARGIPSCSPPRRAAP
jgi:hypothetical protein